MKEKKRKKKNGAATKIGDMSDENESSKNNDFE